MLLCFRSSYCAFKKSVTEATDADNGVYCGLQEREKQFAPDGLGVYDGEKRNGRIRALTWSYNVYLNRSRSTGNNSKYLSIRVGSVAYNVRPRLIIIRVGTA